MENYIFTIIYERGEQFEIIAPDEKTAFEILWKNHPEYRGFDLSRVEKKQTNI